MAVLTVGQVREIRAWVGSTPNEEELEVRMGDLGQTTLHVARQVLQERKGELTAGPEVWSAEGDYSESNKEVMKQLAQDIRDLSLLIEGQTIPGYDPETAVAADPAYMVRDDRERLPTMAD